MLHELPLFPVRPARQAGESLAGFFSRHFGTNGHWMPKALHDAVATVYGSDSPLKRLDAWELISKVMGASPNDYRRFWIEDRFTLTQAEAVTLRRYWQKPATRRFRLCPECLDVTGAHLAFWDLPLVFVCPVHRRLLVTQCHCGKPLAWANVAPDWSCLCGQSLSSLTARTAPRSLVKVARTIAAATDLHVPGLAHREIERYRLGNDLRSTYDVLAWLKALIRELHGPSRAKHPANAIEHWRIGPALDDWPNGLVRLLRHVMRRWHQRDRSSPLVHLQEHSRTQRLLQLLDEATANATLPSTLRSALAEMTTSLRFSCRAPSQWIFNPALSVIHRQEKLNELLTWWQGLLGWIDLSEDMTCLKTARHPGLDGVEERVCVMLLNRLTTAAVQAVAPANFRRFASAWPPMPMNADSLPATEFLELLSQQLLAISSGHRAYLFESALDAAGVTRAAT